MYVDQTTLHIYFLLWKALVFVKTCMLNTMPQSMATSIYDKFNNKLDE